MRKKILTKLVNCKNSKFSSILSMLHRSSRSFHCDSGKNWWWDDDYLVSWWLIITFRSFFLRQKTEFSSLHAIGTQIICPVATKNPRYSYGDW